MKYTLLTLSLLLTLGCAALDDRLDSYDRSAVSQSYHLPKGMRSWSTDIGYTNYGSDLEKEEESHLVGVNPLRFRIPITDSFTWNISPLPIGFTWSIIDKEKHKLAVDYNDAIFISDSSIRYKYIFSPTFAIEPSYRHFSMDIFFYRTEESVFQLSPIFKVHSKWVLKPSIGYGTVSGDSDFLKIIFENISGITIDTSEKYDVMTYGLEAFYNMSKQWDMSFGISSYSVLDQSDALRPVFAKVSFTKYWDGITSGKIEKSNQAP